MENEMRNLLITNFILLILLGSGASQAASKTIEVVKVEGDVVVRDVNGKNEKRVVKNTKLPVGSNLLTLANGRIAARVADAGYIVLAKNSMVQVGEANDHADIFRKVTGMIYFAFNSIKNDDKEIELRTTVATLGIRGTRFLVTDTDEVSEVGMRKGLITVTSPDGDFEIHRKKEQDEFAAFKQEGLDAIAKEKKQFEDYKAKTAQEFIEYKREFSLGANRMVRFDGKHVDERPLSDETEKNMKDAEAFAEAWLKEIQD
jgi:hypothetical protein